MLGLYYIALLVHRYIYSWLLCLCSKIGGQTWNGGVSGVPTRTCVAWFRSEQESVLRSTGWVTVRWDGGRSISKASWVITIKRQVVPTLRLAHWLQCDMVFQQFFGHIVELVPSLRRFKNCIVVVIRILHQQPFTNSCFHSLSIV